VLVKGIPVLATVIKAKSDISGYPSRYMYDVKLIADSPVSDIHQMQLDQMQMGFIWGDSNMEWSEHVDDGTAPVLRKRYAGTLDVTNLGLRLDHASTHLKR
jgi:hypothetical protein